MKMGMPALWRVTNNSLLKKTSIKIISETILVIEKCNKWFFSKRNENGAHKFSYIDDIFH